MLEIHDEISIWTYLLYVSNLYIEMKSTDIIVCKWIDQDQQQWGAQRYLTFFEIGNSLSITATVTTISEKNKTKGPVDSSSTKLATRVND